MSLSDAEAGWTRRSLAARIDHTLLDPGATEGDVDRLCDEALELGLFAVCVAPVWVSRCATRLGGGPVRVCSVVGFPSGAHLPEVKALEARRAVEQGARELDMMIDLGALRSGNQERVRRDIEAVVNAAAGFPVKAILETARLHPPEKVLAARLAVAAGARFVKTSTGFGPGGASLEDVRLLRDAVGATTGVKASGGIRTLDQALALLRAGASRLGTSAGGEIVRALPWRAEP